MDDQTETLPVLGWRRLGQSQRDPHAPDLGRFRYTEHRGQSRVAGEPLAGDAQQAGIAAVERTRHLTAGRAGALARAAGAQRAVPFHHSARYGDCQDAPAARFQAAFAGGDRSIG